MWKNPFKPYDILSEEQVVKIHDQAMLILERGEAVSLPPAIVVQGTGDDNVTPDMADRFAAAYRARGGRLELHKFAGQPHTFIPRDPASEASARATGQIRDFVLAQTGAG